MFWKESSRQEVEQCDREEDTKERGRRRSEGGEEEDTTERGGRRSRSEGGGGGGAREEEEEECQVVPSGSETLQRSSGCRGDAAEPLTGSFF